MPIRGDDMIYDKVGIVLRRADGAMFIAQVTDPEEIEVRAERWLPRNPFGSGERLVLDAGPLDVTLHMTNVKAYEHRWVYPDDAAQVEIEPLAIEGGTA